MTGFSADQIVSAANLTAAVWLFVLSGVAFWYASKLCFKSDNDSKIMVTGLGIEALGWAIHRGWWGIIRRLRADIGDSFYLAWSNTWFMQAISFSLVMAGLILILTPVWKTYIGSGWRVIPAALVLSTFWMFIMSELYLDFSDLSASNFRP